MSESAFAPSRTAGGTQYFSGIVAGGESASSNALDEVRAAYSKAAAVLESEGFALADVVYVTAYLSRAEDFDAYDVVWREVFPTNPPARTTVAAQLLVRGARVELSIIAAALM